MSELKNILIVLLFLLIDNPLSAQSNTEGLNVDSNYNYIQFYSPEVREMLQEHFTNVSSEKLVFVHYGGSHIQAEIPTTIAREMFQDKYGDGGRGLIFNYGAANTYSSVNGKYLKTTPI